MSSPLVVSQPIAEPLSGRERRRSARYSCGADGDCQPVTANDVGNRWPVQVLDVSAGGVGLLVSRRFEPGTLLAVEFNCQSKDSAYMPLARVCRVTPAGPLWLLGCTWGRIVSAEELRPLVGAAAMWQEVRKQYRRTKAALESACGDSAPLPAAGAA